MNTCRKLLSALLCLALLASVLPLGAVPARAAGENTLEGKGTQDEPYLIKDAEDLIEFARRVNDNDPINEKEGELNAWAELKKDIDLENTSWTPIAYNYEHPYSGTFDGNNHIISGLSINNSSTNYGYFGLFGAVGEGGTVTNLTVEGSITVNSGSNVRAGGVVASNDGDVSNCTSEVAITVEANIAYIGGIIGSNAGNVSNCTNKTDITATANTAYIGGVIGFNGGSLTNCSNSGAVEGTGQTANGAYVGGIVGSNSHTEIVMGSVENCYNTGTVTATGSNAVAGGVAGINLKTVSSCYNTGTVTGTTTAGGVVGANIYGTSPGTPGTVTSCYNIGKVTAPSEGATIGGVVGANSNGTINGTVNGCYFLVETAASGVGDNSSTNVTNVTSKTTGEFASGEVAWLLQDALGENADQAWGQKLSGETPDEYPVLTSDTSKKVYQVTFKDGDSIFATDYANNNDCVTLPENDPPAVTGKTFDGWYNQETDGTEYENSVPVNGSDLVVYAQFTENAPALGAGYDINYTAETATAAENYQISTNGTDFSKDTCNITPDGTLYVRYEGNKIYTTNPIPARPDAPTVQGVNETVAGKNDGKITGLTAGISYELSSNDSKTWIDVAADSTEITGLAPGTYQVRIKAGTNSFASEAASVIIASGDAPTYTLTVSAPTFGNVNEGYTQPAAQALTIANSGNSDATVSSVALTGDTTAFVLNKTDGCTIAAGTTDQTTYTIQPAAGLLPGTYSATITVTYNNDATATANVQFIVEAAPVDPTPAPTPTPDPDPSGPSTGESDGWESIADEIAAADDGDSITIDMNGETEVPFDIFEDVAGKDVDLVFDMGDGLSWSVNGQDIPEGTNLSDLDLGVDLGTDGIPVDVINAITGEKDSVQITLAYDGDFGFTLTLTAPLGEDNAGYWANLYHYDEDTEAMNFEAAAEIDADGSVSLPLSHASQYAIVIDDHSHAATDVSEIFTDVPANHWAQAAIQYVYDNGLMTGISDTAFAPEATTTRAMIVSMLARMENVTSAADAGFTDVNASDWYATAVNWAAANGIVNGISDDTFAPNDPITREQLAAMLMNYAQWKGQDTSARADLSGYSDAPSTWASEAVQWAVAEGLLAGVTDDELQPQGQATRAQVAAILERFLEA